MADLTPDAQTTPDAGAGDGKPTEAAGATLLTQPPADAKPAEAVAAPADPKPADAKPADEKPAGAPEKYEFTLPDGLVLDEAMLSKAEPVLRELGLTNEQAGKLAGLIAQDKLDQVKAAEDAHASQAAEWVAAVKADPELGGKAFEANVKLSNTAIAAFGSPELTALLIDTGLGNHPELVRFCQRVGKALGEDGLNRPADTTVASAVSTAAVLFDHPSSKPATR